MDLARRGNYKTSPVPLTGWGRRTCPTEKACRHQGLHVKNIYICLSIFLSIFRAICLSMGQGEWETEGEAFRNRKTRSGEERRYKVLMDVFLAPKGWGGSRVITMYSGSVRLCRRLRNNGGRRVNLSMLRGVLLVGRGKEVPGLGWR